MSFSKTRNLTTFSGRKRRAAAAEPEIYDTGWVEQADGTRTFHQSGDLGEFPITHGQVEVQLTFRSEPCDD